MKLDKPALEIRLQSPHLYQGLSQNIMTLFFSGNAISGILLKLQALLTELVGRILYFLEKLLRQAWTNIYSKHAQ